MRNIIPICCECFIATQKFRGDFSNGLGISETIRCPPSVTQGGEWTPIPRVAPRWSDEACGYKGTAV